MPNQDEQSQIDSIAKRLGSDNEHELQPSEQKFRRLFQSLPLPVYTWQRIGDDFELVDFNDAANAITDGSISDFVGITSTAMYPDRSDIVEDISRCFAEKASFRREMDYLFKSSGESKKLVVQYAYVPPDLVLVQTEDVTEFHKALEEASYERDLMQILLERAPDYVYFKDLDRRFVRASKSIADLFHVDVDDIIGKRDEDLIPPEAAKDTILDDRRVIETGIPLINKEEGGESIGGEPLYVLTSKLPWYDDNGDIVGLFCVSKDITDRKRVEAELRESEASYRHLVENINDVLYEVDTEGVVTYVSSAIESILGLPPEQLVGQPFAKYVLAQDLNRAIDNVQVLVAGKSPGPGDYRVLDASGGIRWIRVSSRPIINVDRVEGFRGVMTDITEVKRVEEQLEEAAAAAERQRLARELHDSVTQTLYGVSLYSNATKEALTAGKIDTATEHVEVIQDLSQSALVDMRLLIFELKPPILIEKGLAQALRERLDLVEARAGFNTGLRVTSEDPVPQEIEAELYAVATEALNNTLKHAQAENVGVVLEVDKHVIRLEISDDGVGFDAEATDRSEGFGFRSMNERAERLGGTFNLVSAPGEGTTVSVEVPV